MSARKKKVMLIDGNSLLFRAFYALPLLQTKEGIFTNGVYGFLTMFNRVMEQEQPTHVLVALDKERASFRNEIYDAYKGHRSNAPDELVGQFALLREVLTVAGIPWLEVGGYEADDIIGTLSAYSEKQEVDCIIVTGDGDALQLVSEKVSVLMTRKGITSVERYTPETVREKWEVDPPYMIDIKALMGDSSDNIPGVPGIGPKTAIKLIKEFKDITSLYEHIDRVSNQKQQGKLTDYKEQAFLSYQLAAIDRKMDLPFGMEGMCPKEPDRQQLAALYKKLEFHSFLKKMAAEAAIEPELVLVPVQETDVTVLYDQERALELTQFCSGKKIGLYLAVDNIHPMWVETQDVYLEVDREVYQLHIPAGAPERWTWLKTLLEDDHIDKYLHNAKYAQVLLLRYGITLRGIAGDTMLLAYVNDPAFNGDQLQAALVKYLNLDVPSQRPDQMVLHLRSLYAFFQECLNDDLKQLYNGVEMPLSSVLADMEFTGIKVDRATLADLSSALSRGIAQCEEYIFQLAGRRFNILSPKQLGQVLFEDLGLRKVKKTKTGYSTGAEVLEALYDDHEIIPIILEYRQLSKLKSTYADALQAMIHPVSGRVHTIFKQAQTTTGRLSSIDPNLQNIPIRMEAGREIRTAFTASSPDRVLLSADYSQIDLRSLAHISEDQALIETFRQGLDIHQRTAAEIFKVPLEQVNSDLRHRAKAVNFGIVYGISDFGLARDTGVSRAEARQYIDSYLDSYPGVKKYMQDIVVFAQEHGYVETILKRRRYLPDINARNKTVQSFAKRMALNTPIQGTSADIIKLAMLDIAETLKANGLQAKLLLQVHDELVLEVTRDELPVVAVLLRQAMENAFALAVPLDVNLKTGDNWNTMQDWNG